MSRVMSSWNSGAKRRISAVPMTSPRRAFCMNDISSSGVTRLLVSSLAAALPPSAPLLGAGAGCFIPFAMCCIVSCR